MLAKGLTIVPGCKLCPSCRVKVSEYEHVPSDDSTGSDDVSLSEEVGPEVSFVSEREVLNTTLSELDMSPIKLHSIPQSSKVSHGKQKIRQANEALSKRVASYLDVDAEALDISNENPVNLSNKEINEKADDLDYLVDLMKEKLKVSNRRRKIQILTITPHSWSLRKAAQVFNVSKSTVQKSRRLRDERGILASPEQVKGKRLPQQVVDLIKEFYCDDEFTRQLPGKKDCVSLGNKQCMSKRLILCNLKELFAAFRVKYPDNKISFLKFASLRPKWCITVGPKGTHSVCVCTKHQNVKLMLGAVDLESSYHDLIEMIVCGRESKECMLHRCPSCPGIEPLQSSLNNELQGRDGEILQEVGDEAGAVPTESDEEDERMDEEGEYEEEERVISYKQWTSTDRADFICQTATIDEFIETLCSKLDDITSHSYIACSQAKYLKSLKESLNSKEVIVLGDFAENYQFVVQDEIQGYHWNKQQCTLHPIVIYYQSDGNLLSKSLCFISDDLEHDVNIVYKIIAATIDYLKHNVSDDIKKVHYFTDRCAGQYKNCKNFLNLCHQKDDFSIDCEWNFFATSHGKSLCDGIGGTVKRLTAKASLQWPIDEQIVTALAMLNFCRKEIRGIDFAFINSKDVVVTRNEMKERYIHAKTVPGTRSFHQFIPQSINTIAAKHVSDDSKYAIKVSFMQETHKIKAKPGQFLVCKYDGSFWVGMTCNVDDANDDVEVKFMKPTFPACSFTWPTRDDICWVPNVHIITTIRPPTMSTYRACQYCLEADEIRKINDINSMQND